MAQCNILQTPHENVFPVKDLYQMRMKKACLKISPRKLFFLNRKRRILKSNLIGLRI